MTAVLPDREPTAAEREHSPLVAELEHVRELLGEFRGIRGGGERLFAEDR